MKYITAKEQTLSRFSLGTVQLGMKYGLGEDCEKPSEEVAFQMLDRAMELGVNNVDTANNYGDSEAVIGRWVRRRKAENQTIPWIVTKIGPFDHGSYDKLRDDMLMQTENCCKNLGLDSLDCLMLHDFEDYEEDADAVRKIMEEMKGQGLYRYSAISAYSRHDYGMIADSGFDAVQIPLNVFDWTQILNGGMEKLQQSGMMIFVRSVFLQGLVFKTPQTLDSRMDFCLPYVQRYQQLCREFDLSPEILALSFVLSIPGVTTTVLGCDNITHLQANAGLIEKTVTLTQEQMNQLQEAFCEMDPRVINPGVWFNHT